MMYQIQRDKCFPLPTYDLNTINRVTVTVYGKILDKNYTQLLYSNEDLDMRTVFLLDKVQKQEVVSKESFKDLKKKVLWKDVILMFLYLSRWQILSDRKLLMFEIKG